MTFFQDEIMKSTQRILAMAILLSSLLGIILAMQTPTNAFPPATVIISPDTNQSKLGKSSNSSLEQVLAAGLKCRRPQEFAFVKMVALRVHNGTLPRELVESTFFWARKQQDQYPYISFRYALELRAKKAGFSL
jgi:hypothetical protein